MNNEHSASDGPGADGAFRQRMVAQCRQIDRYWLAENRLQHRHIRRQEAALEWIERHAGEFIGDTD